MAMIALAGDVTEPAPIVALDYIVIQMIRIGLRDDVIIYPCVHDGRIV